MIYDMEYIKIYDEKESNILSQIKEGLEKSLQTLVHGGPGQN